MLRKKKIAKKLDLEADPKALYDYAESLLKDSSRIDHLHLAHVWHTKAAKAGYPKAMEEEGSFILRGWVEGTLEDAFQYFSKAFNAGYKKASYGIGQCYFYGWGVERSLEKARYYYKIAKRSGCFITWTYLKSLKRMTEEEFLNEDYEKALKDLRKSYN